MLTYITCQQTVAITDHRVLNGDLNEHNTVYGGKLLEVLDGTASISATKFAQQQLVTASVDQFNFIAPFKLKDSFRIISYVSGVGTRSLEVFAKIIGYPASHGKPFLGATAFLTFVALNKHCQLPKLKPETSEEIAVCQIYPTRKKVTCSGLLLTSD
nr:acyl-CoA thioesterase [Liquorilactobacillus vini]